MNCHSANAHEFCDLVRAVPLIMQGLDTLLIDVGFAPFVNTRNFGLFDAFTLTLLDNLWHLKNIDTQRCNQRAGLLPFCNVKITGGLLLCG